jgi:hypothetical protein
MENERFKSYDYFDVKTSPIGLWFERHNQSILKIPYLGLNYLDYYHPNFMRMQTKKTISATTIALYTTSQFLRYQQTGDQKFIGKGVRQLQWLENNASRGYSGYCWGLPFPWQLPQGLLVQSSTPCSTIIIYMLDAFLHGFKVTDNAEYLDAAVSTAEFFLNDLNVHTCDDDSICLSYTPLDSFQVINVNAYAAATLYTIYQFNRDQDLKDYADRLIQFVLNEQNEDGSWYYWAENQRKNYIIDSLHQCYIIENLYRCHRINQNPQIISSVKRALNFFRAHFLQGGKILKRRDEKGKIFGINMSFPVELIDHAESLKMFTLLKDDFYTNREMEQVFDYCMNVFKIPGKPYFYSYIINERKFDIPYMRWGQSQILHALTLYYSKKHFHFDYYDIIPLTPSEDIR